MTLPTKLTTALFCAALILPMQGCETTKKYEADYKDISCKDLASYAAMATSQYPTQYMENPDMGSLGHSSMKGPYHDKKGAMDTFNQSTDARRNSAIRKIYTKKC